ncbi:MAG: alpha/beta hydrolase [Myxococcaceae bacterium]
MPFTHPRFHGVEVLRDVAYLDSGLPEHRLDIYRPARRSGPLPVVFYIHGGGFRILSKDSHWLFGLIFARAGYMVVNVSYRLAPRHPFPSALVDCCEAYDWMARNIELHGGDLSRLVVAGESAGANLATSLALTTCYRRPEQWARKVFDRGVVPRAVLPASGYLQISDPERFLRGSKMPTFLHDRLAEVTDAYLGGLRISHPWELDLADPLVVLERGKTPERELPRFFASCGTADPLVEDTRRLKAALDKLQVPCEARLYEGGMHSFHAFLFRHKARQYWKDVYSFLGRSGAGPRPVAVMDL